MIRSMRSVRQDISIMSGQIDGVFDNDDDDDNDDDNDNKRQVTTLMKKREFFLHPNNHHTYGPVRTKAR
jgi:hypothetical protein